MFPSLSVSTMINPSRMVRYSGNKHSKAPIGARFNAPKGFWLLHQRTYHLSLTQFNFFDFAHQGLLIAFQQLHNVKHSLGKTCQCLDVFVCELQRSVRLQVK